MNRRELTVHALLLVTSVAFAGIVWTRDKKPVGQAADVTVWPGRASDVTRVTYEGKSHRLMLEAKRDERGRFFVGSDACNTAPPTSSDGGIVQDPGASARTMNLLSVSAAEKLAEAIAPLRSPRALGPIGDDKAREFGLDIPDGTLVVVVGGVERRLVVGGVTPGGSDRYVRNPETGEVYVLRGDIFRDIDTPEARLVERDLHEWKDGEVRRATLRARGKARDVVHGGSESKRVWADATSADQADETIGNWMGKLDRLRPTEYRTSPPEPRTDVARIEYSSGDLLGFLEIVKSPASDGKADYFVRTERTRLFGKVSGALAEQVEQDAESIVR